MPELPEVETTRRGIAPLVEGRRVTGVNLRQPRLRWPVPEALPAILTGQRCHAVGRRAKYLLLRFDRGHLLLHLGMSGSLRVLPQGTPPGKHDHLDLALDNGRLLRLRDPRRFGAALWLEEPPERHPLLARLGPEPLSEDFSVEHLRQACAGRRQAIKARIMDARTVVGVGNIYACEALFSAGIHPFTPAGRLSARALSRLHRAIRHILARAIEAGGSTLKDFQQADGKPGYFAQQLAVYGREGRPCPRCGQAIEQRRQQGRSSWFCPRCQPEKSP